MADPREIHYAGGQTILNKELTEQKIEEAVQPIINNLANEVTRATGREDELAGDIADLSQALAHEVDARQNGDNTINNKIGDLANLETHNKSDVVSAINELVHEMPEVTDPDTAMSDTSENAVQNKVIKEYVDGKETALQEQIDNINDTLDEVLPLDDVPTEGSEKGVKSGGTFDAIRFASVKVGETMFWPESELETREVHSDDPFNFHFKGHEYSVTTQDGSVDLVISKNYPDGWHALDGKAELLAADYPELAAFMPENVTNESKIWLPYVRQKIIKVRY